MLVIRIQNFFIQEVVSNDAHNDDNHEVEQRAPLYYQGERRQLNRHYVILHIQGVEDAGLAHFIQAVWARVRLYPEDAGHCWQDPKQEDDGVEYGICNHPVPGAHEEDEGRQPSQHGGALLDDALPFVIAIHTQDLLRLAEPKLQERSLLLLELCHYLGSVVYDGCLLKLAVEGRFDVASEHVFKLLLLRLNKLLPKLILDHLLHLVQLLVRLFGHLLNDLILLLQFFIRQFVLDQFVHLNFFFVWLIIIILFRL